MFKFPNSVFGSMEEAIREYDNFLVNKSEIDEATLENPVCRYCRHCEADRWYSSTFGYKEMYHICKNINNIKGNKYIYDSTDGSLSTNYCDMHNNLKLGKVCPYFEKNEGVDEDCINFINKDIRLKNIVFAIGVAIFAVAVVAYYILR